jgi:hypothetical protein
LAPPQGFVRTSRPGVIISTSARLLRGFRTPARLVAATVTALSLMTAVPTAQAASLPAASHLTATAKPLTVLTHSTVVIAGVVSPRGTGVVNLQRYSASKWIKVSHKTTSKTGSYSFGVQTSGKVATTIYRVTRAASSTAKAVVSKTMHVHVVKTAYKVKAAAASSSVVGGTPIVVTGSVSPKAKGTVLLEVLLHGVWHDVASAKLTSTSTYSLKMIEPTGVYALRVRSPLTATIASGVSPSVKVTVTAPTTAAPTASITLGGTATSPGVYSGTVTATAHTTAAAGAKSVTYSLDGAAAKPYTAAVSVSAAGNHTLTVTVTDQTLRTATATSTWTIQGADTIKPNASISLSGTPGSSADYAGNVGVTINSSDASGIKSVKYTLDGGSLTTYAGAFSVSTAGSHSVIATVTDNANNVTTTPPTSWTQQSAAGSPDLVVSTADQAVLGQAGARLVFSTWRGATDPVPAQLVTLTNNGNAALQISNLTIGGTDATSYRLTTGQATSFPIAAGGSATVSVEFHPTDPTNCSGTADVYAIGLANRDATLTFSTNDAAQPSGSAALSGLNACGQGGNGEPVLEQVLQALGYTDNTYNGFDHRYIGPSRLVGSDEIISPYFVAANSAAPVSLVPVAHYGSPNSTASYQSTGWYAQGSAMASGSFCSSACKTLWQFPADPPPLPGPPQVLLYNQNQKLLPTPTGATTFSPTGAFGLFSSDFSEVNFSDDSLNVANDTTNHNMAVPHYLHQLRVYPAYGPGHVAIPNTYLVADDLSRVPGYKNNDYQDVVLLLSNVVPATSQGRVVNASGDNLDLTSGISVGSDCSVTGFDGVMGNTSGANPCNFGNIAATGTGLALTSTSGQLADNNQQNALYRTFDASRGAFTISTHVVGSVNQVTQNYQQIAAFFGPDDKNFIKIEAEHNGVVGSPPRLTLFYDRNGTGTSDAFISPPGLATASTLDLVIKGNANVADPIPTDSDPDKVHGFPLDELTVWYSINGAALQQLGSTIEFPANVSGWFSRQAKAGILVANPGSGAGSITATFSSFSVAAG